MKNNLKTAGIVSLLVISGFLGFITFNPEVARAAGATIYVDDDNAGSPTMDGSMLDPYDTIQKGIDNATEGDTVFVFNGTYFENVIVNRTINLTGEDRNTTIIDGGGSGDVVYVNASWVNISGFMMNNSGNTGWPDYDCGIKLDDVQNCSIINNYISNTWVGIYVISSSNITITDNNVSSNGEKGIYLYLSSNNTVTGNYVSNNWDGIWLEDTNGTNIYDNTVYNQTSYGIRLISSNGNNLTGNTISNNFYGIVLNSCRWNNITKNTLFSNDGVGISLILSSSNNYIYHNNMINNVGYDDTNNGNQWDNGYPSGGNYWSDFSPGCPDLYSGSTTPQTTGSPDGICDNQYDIDADSTDYYPLKNPWNPSNTPPSAPINLIPTTGDSYVNITWDAPASDGGLPIINYTIYRNETPGGETFLIEIGNFTHYNDTSVTNGVTYYYQVSAVNIIGEGPFSNEVNATPLSVPDAPTGLGATTGDAYINLTWNAPASDGGSPIINYSVYRSTIIGFKEFLTQIGNITYYNDTGVTKGETYYYLVSAVNSVGEGPESNGLIVTLLTVPDAPSGLTAIAGDSYVNLTWNAPTFDGGFPIINYTIYRNGTSFAEIENVTYYNDTTVGNGVTYYYKVSAVNLFGEGPASSEVNATPVTVPSAPISLAATVGDSYIYLTWSVPSSDGGSPITNYTIYRGNISGGEEFFTVIENVLFYNDTSVINGVTYYYKVSANNSLGEGPLPNEVNATPMTLPSAPSNLTAVSGVSYVNLTWDAPSSNGGSPIINYTIYRGGTSGGETPLAQIGNVTHYNDTSVTNGITYHYKVSANNSVGEGPLSNEAGVTAGTVPSAPIGLIATAGDSYIEITWSAPASDGGLPVTNYRIYRGTISGGEILHEVFVSALFYNDTTVTPGFTYYYKVRAVNTIGEGAPSEEVNATPVSVPEAPTDLNAMAGDSYINLTWGPPFIDGGSTITNYKIYRGNATGNETFLDELEVVFHYNDTDVENNVTYFYFITAVNGKGDGPSSYEVNATPSPPPVVVNQPPTCALTTAIPGKPISGIFDINGTALDNDGTVELVQIKIGEDGDWIDVNGTTNWDYKLDTTKLSNGKHTIYIRSYDGENYSEEISMDIKVDNPPEQQDLTILVLIALIALLIIIMFLLIKKMKGRPSEEFEEEEEEEIEDEEEEIEEEEPEEDLEEEEEEAEEELEEEEL